jgi:MFS family permease
LLAGRLGRWVGDGPSVCLGAAIAIVYLLIYSLTDNLSWIYVASWFRGMADVIILASSYAFVSVLIPPERRGTLFSLFNATLFLSWGVAGTLIAGPIVDLLFHAGISQAIAYRAAYLSGLVMVIIGLSIQMFLVFVLMPKTGISAQRSGN